MKKITVILLMLTTMTGFILKSHAEGDKSTMMIKVTSNGKVTEFRLNNSTASKDLYDQLPMTIKVENFGGNEKIFYPPKKLNTADTPKANAKNGTLAYYAPWGDVVMFYEDFGSASGLYELGEATSGKELISKMSGNILIEK
ncbi:MAG: cyclophilin-like fold protein [Deferribacterales bacterium]